MSARPKILIVDDNKINLVVLKNVLEEVEAELIEAGDGKEALVATLNHDFALAILDVQMPNMDGYELAESIRADDKTRNLPIIFVTAAYSDDSHMFRSYQAGGVDYLMKPYPPEVLLAKVRIFLDLDRDRRELQRHRDQLEDIVSERVRDIDKLNKRLRKSNKELMKRNEEIQYFYQSLAHELKTPLTSAMEFLSFVTEDLVGPLTDRQREYLEIVQDNCSNLTIYINDLLDMTRLDTGKLHLDPEPVRPGKLIKQAVSMMKNEAKNRDIQLQVNLDEGIDEIVVDKSRISQVLLNLLTNAIKFTPATGRVELCLFQLPDRPDWVGISVQDNGCGIAEDQLPYIFRRYFQGNASSYELQQGFGLGLYLSREIVQLHGGDIEVESSPDAGSIFRVLLPVKQPSRLRKRGKKKKSHLFFAGR